MARAYVVRTPELVEFSFPLAGVAARALAWVIDLAVTLVLLVLVLLLGALATLLLGLAGLSGVSLAFAWVAGFTVLFGYPILTEWALGGRTVGKWCLGLRVMDATGLSAGFVAIAVRNLVRLVDVLPGAYLVGGLAALWDPHNRRLGDLAAGTVVLRAGGGSRLPRGGATPPAVLEALRADLGGRGRVGRRLGREERDLVLELALRRDELALPTRMALFREMAEHLGRRLDLAKDLRTSDENLVLGLATVLSDRLAERAPGLPRPL